VAANCDRSRSQFPAAGAVLHGIGFEATTGRTDNSDNDG